MGLSLRIMKIETPNIKYEDINMIIRKCQVNHMENPLGFDLGTPVFHWVVDESKGTKTTEARIIVSSGGKLIHDTGFSDLNNLGTSLNIKLLPRTRYNWTVTVRTNASEEVESPVQFFETGKKDEPWVGKWIHSDSQEKDKKRHPIFSRKVKIVKKVTSARLYVCGLGMFSATLNDERIGDEYLTPYCNNYNAWVQSIAFDVTEQLMEGQNDLAITLGNGWYNSRFGVSGLTEPYYGTEMKLIGELKVQYEDGTEETIGTDENWDVTRSQITLSGIYEGEHRDDTLPAVDASKAKLCEAPKGKLMDRLSLPVVIREERKAQELIVSPKDEQIIDFGQNLAGSFRINVHGLKAGEKVHIQVGEVLQDGCFYNDNYRSAQSEFIYISNGVDKIVQPEFTFYGYRYAKVEGIQEFAQEDLTALVMYSDMPEIGSLVTGHEKVNRLILNAEWSKRGNFIDVPTDCPQRDERMGWTGDAEVFAPTALLQSDAYAFYNKYLYDMTTEQEENDGIVPDVIPSFGVNNGGTCAWSDATTIIPWKMYEYTGDKTILEKHYPSMKSWVDFMKREEDNNHAYIKKYQWGDWLALDGDNSADAVKGGTDDDYCAAAYYLYSTRILTKTANLLDKKDDAEYYGKLEKEILEFIRSEFFTVTGRSTVDTQTGYLLGIQFGLGPDSKRMEQSLIKKFDENAGKLQTGFIGTPFLAETLTQIGHSDLAYELLFNEEYPGWLYEVNHGATTIWERWNSMLEDGSVSSTGMNSFNHYSYGSIVSWIYQYAAGLRQDPEVPGYKKVIFAPIPNKKLGHSEVTYDSSAGLWKSYWKILDDNRLELSLRVPFGCEAEVVLPNVPEDVFEQTNPLFANVKDGVCHVGPGVYKVVYEMTAEAIKYYSLDSKLWQLLKNPLIKGFLSDNVPNFSMLPSHYFSESLRTVAKIFADAVTEDQLQQIDMMLKQIEVV